MPRRSFAPPWDRCPTIWGPGSSPPARRLDAGPSADLVQRRTRNRSRPSETGRQTEGAGIRLLHHKCHPRGGLFPDRVRSGPPRPSFAESREASWASGRPPDSNASSPGATVRCAETGWPGYSEAIRPETARPGSSRREPGSQSEVAMASAGFPPAGRAPSVPLHAKMAFCHPFPAHTRAFRTRARLPAGPEEG